MKYMCDKDFLSVQETASTERLDTFEEKTISEIKELRDTVTKNGQDINDLKDHSATKAELNQEIKDLESAFRATFKLYLFIAIIIAILSMSVIYLFIPSSDSTEYAVTESANSETESSTIIEELGLPASNDYEEFSHDSTDNAYLFDWTLADGTRISNQYTGTWINFDTGVSAGIDNDVESYIFVYNDDHLVYKTTFTSRGFSTKKCTYDNIIKIVTYQVKDGEVFRKDTFNNIDVVK